MCPIKQRSMSQLNYQSFLAVSQQQLHLVRSRHLDLRYILTIHGVFLDQTDHTAVWNIDWSCLRNHFVCAKLHWLLLQRQQQLHSYFYRNLVLSDGVTFRNRSADAAETRLRKHRHVGRYNIYVATPECGSVHDRFDVGIIHNFRNILSVDDSCFFTRFS